MMINQSIRFHNNRVLHGRSAFKLVPGVKNTRHLEGAYISFDVLKSKMRVINEQIGDTPHVSL